MSRILLDTNIVIALINKTVNRLPHRIGEFLGMPEMQPVVSTVTPWEISIKVGIGKLQIDEEVRNLGRFLEELGCDILPVSLEHALEVAHPEPATKDPFDRLLLAVCACEGLKLLTTDNQLAGHRLVW
jgi:PIN domain nuclease of toxin-antitoxin system